MNKGECKPIPGHTVANQSLQTEGNPPKPACVSTYEETLMDVYEYSVSVGLPYRHVQIDSWCVELSPLLHCATPTDSLPYPPC